MVSGDGAAFAFARPSGRSFLFILPLPPPSLLPSPLLRPLPPPPPPLPLPPPLPPRSIGQSKSSSAAADQMKSAGDLKPPSAGGAGRRRRRQGSTPRTSDFRRSSKCSPGPGRATERAGREGGRAVGDEDFLFAEQGGLHGASTWTRAWSRHRPAMPGSRLLTRKHGPRRLSPSGAGARASASLAGRRLGDEPRVADAQRARRKAALRDGPDALGGQRLVVQQPGRDAGADRRGTCAARRSPGLAGPQLRAGKRHGHALTAPPRSQRNSTCRPRSEQRHQARRAGQQGRGDRPCTGWKRRSGRPRSARPAPRRAWAFARAGLQEIVAAQDRQR